MIYTVNNTVLMFKNLSHYETVGFERKLKYEMNYK